jgi:riboflavin synthase
MFTGIIEEVGKVVSISRHGSTIRLEIGADIVLKDTKIGDSIATNGVCLTVTDITGSSFFADAMPETVNTTALKTLINGSKVNLERALTLSSRLGGHIVTGHVDGTGIISEIKKDENAILLNVSTSPEILKYIVHKGSITIDGVSLTVIDVTDSYFSVSIIPHTQTATTLTSKTVGSIVNLENDILGRYVEKLLRADTSTDNQKSEKSHLTMEFLKENGFY